MLKNSVRKFRRYHQNHSEIIRLASASAYFAAYISAYLFLTVRRFRHILRYCIAALALVSPWRFFCHFPAWGLTMRVADAFEKCEVLFAPEKKRTSKEYLEVHIRACAAAIVQKSGRHCLP